MASCAIPPFCKKEKKKKEKKVWLLFGLESEGNKKILGEKERRKERIGMAGASSECSLSKQEDQRK